MKIPKFNIGDGALFYGEQVTIERFDPRCTIVSDSYEYIIRTSSGLSFAAERELEPVELDYDDVR